MFAKLYTLTFNGFSITDLPFLLMQLSVSAILAWLIRNQWKKGKLEIGESIFLKYLLPLQVVLTTLSIYSLKSPWIVVLFGLLALLPVIGPSSFSMRSKVFYLIIVFIAFGCGAANLAVTVFIVLLIILPSLYIYNSGIENE